MHEPTAPSNAPITVVSGLPRSGTSLMMRMLEAGGIPPLTDGERSADDDNPRGYYELEAVKRTAGDRAWLGRAQGHAVKVISQLLGDLPPGHRYRIVFMRRKLDEVLASQKVMLERRGEPSTTSDDDMRDTFAAHVADVESQLRAAGHCDVLFVSYNRLMADPEPQVRRIADFLGGDLDQRAMAEVVEPDLYRQRR